MLVPPMRGSRNRRRRVEGEGAAPHRSVALAAHGRELGVTLEVLVGFRGQVSVDLGASPFVAADQTESLGV
jgi:hypothetical protein